MWGRCIILSILIKKRNDVRLLFINYNSTYMITDIYFQELDEIPGNSNENFMITQFHCVPMKTIKYITLFMKIHIQKWF